MSILTDHNGHITRERFSFDASNGQLFVAVKETRNLKNDGLSAFCIIQLDKQQVKTRGIQQINNPTTSESWNEGFTFDVTHLNTQLVVTLLGSSQITVGDEPIDNREGKFLGQLVIPVIALSHQKPIDQWFKLTYQDPTDGSDNLGEVHVKLHYTATKHQVGVSDFKPLLVVGKGTFAKVMMVQKIDTGRLYAMKVINKDAVIQHNAVQHTMAEKNVLKKINHSFIVSLKYSFQTEDKLYMILDYINGGELFYHLSDAEKFDEERTRFYTAEITLALGYLHQLEIVYRDLKPENILLDMNGHICLTDFGLVKENLGFGHVTHTFCGSPEYLAPEIFTANGYDKSVDWWAMGTLMYEMLSGLPPFFSDDLDEMNERILNETLTFPAQFSADAKDLLSKLLERDPKKRLGSGPKDYLEITAHPFFKGIDWSRLEQRAIGPPFRPALRGETDVRFFDPESTMMQAKLSFSECHLTSKEQEAFRGFSYVAPDADLRYMARRRGSSGASRNNSPNISPIPIQARRTTPTKVPVPVFDLKLPSPEGKEKRDFLSKHRHNMENLHILSEEEDFVDLGYSSDPSFDAMVPIEDDEISLSTTSWRPQVPKSHSSPILVDKKKEEERKKRSFLF